MMVEMVETGGNTISPVSQEIMNKNSECTKKSRISAGKSWCFTLNNWTEDDLVEMVESFGVLGLEYVIGKEVGDSGTPHLQGYVRSPKVLRPMETLKLKSKPHWEKCKGSHQDNVKYCTKEGDYITNIRMPRPIVVDEPYGWQTTVVDIVASEPDKRSIYWFWEPDGGVGKSSLVRWLVHKKNALMCSGKAADMKYLVVKYAEQHDGISPDVIIFDVPRSSQGFLSYTGIEEVKNGCFASTKYECGMHLMAHPHVFVFANFPPSIGEDMSADRFRVTRIGEQPSHDWINDQFG